MSKAHKKPFRFDVRKLGKRKEYKFKNKIKYIHANFAVKKLKEINKQIIIDSKLSLSEKKLLEDALYIIDRSKNVILKVILENLKELNSYRISYKFKKILGNIIRRNRNKFNNIYFSIKKKFNTFYIRRENFKECMIDYLTKNKKNTQGFWTCHAFMIKDNDNYENKIKKNLCPNSSLKVSKIDDMLNNYKSLEEILLEKEDKKIKLNKIDKMKLKLIKENIMVEKNIDKDMLNKIGLAYKPKTLEGRFIYLMKVLEKTFEKNNLLNLKKIHFKIYDDFNNISLNELKKEYSYLLDKLNKIIMKEDMIDVQLNELCDNVIPLNQKGFVKLDDFQLETIDNINKGISTIVSAPTSAGKTALSGYLFTKPGNYIVIVPTNALAWQMAAYISGIKKTSVPIVTDTYQSRLNTYDLVKRIIQIGCVVGTAKELLDILVLPELNDFKVDWLLLDEIHMIGKNEGYDMEQILKLYSNTPFLGLSATIGNEEEFANWLLQFNKNVKVVKYTKRFINLQKFVYNNITNNIDRINPIGLIDINEFKTGNILNKEITIHPKDIYDIYIKIKLKYKDINHTKFFKSIKRLSLTDINKFFKHILKFMVEQVKKNDINMINIIKSYKIKEYKEHTNNIKDLYNFIFKLKEEKKTPAIIFNKSSTVIEEIVLALSNYIKMEEMKKYPKLFKDREKKEKKNKKKKDEDTKLTEKQLIKMINKEENMYEEIEIYEPHVDFILNSSQYLNKNNIVEYEELCNNRKYKFFPRQGDSYNWIFDLLYRGIGIYCKGFPDNYLRIVQKLANQKKLAIVFSDKELVFGVSMPFKTSVILNDNSLNTMEYHQMAGRAGRRGLDKVGNVVFFGFNNNRIKELSISMIPKITGNSKSLNYMLKAGVLLSDRKEINNIKNHLLFGKTEFYNNMVEYNIKDKNRYLLHLLWLFRDIKVSLHLENILDIVESTFKLLDPTVENNQILLAEYLLHFFDIKNSESVMNSNELVEKYIKKYKVIMPKNICNMLYLCIRDNRIVLKDSINKDILRKRILKFMNTIRFIQHYYYYRATYYSSNSKYKKNEYITICKLFGKLFTRLVWIYYDSSVYVSNK